MRKLYYEVACMLKDLSIAALLTVGVLCAGAMVAMIFVLLHLAFRP